MNGHKNWNHWNVALWIGNDEGLYKLAREFCRNNGKEMAARDLFEMLTDDGVTHTPDGAPYSKTAIREALRGI